MDIQQLDHFVFLADIEHLSEAADVLDIPLSTLSFEMRKLEKELGVELFSRKGRSIRLNEHGKSLRDSLKPILRDLRSAISELQKGKPSLPQFVTINSPSLFCFPNLMDSLYALGVNFRITRPSLSKDELISGLMENQYDFAISSFYVEYEKLERLELYRQNLVIVIYTGHALSGKTHIDFSELKNENFALHKDGMSIRKCFDDLCQKTGFTPNIIYEGRSTPFLLEMVRSGKGITFLTKEAAQNYCHWDDLHIINISNAKHLFPLYLYRRKDSPLSAEKVQQTIIDYFKSKTSMPDPE